MSQVETTERELVIVGGGPAGLATAVQAHDLGVRNIEIIDPNGVGAGGLRGLKIKSNSAGKDFVAPYEDTHPELLRLDEAKVLRGVEDAIDLQHPVSFLDAVGREIISNGTAHYTKGKAFCLKHTPNGWEIQTKRRIFRAQQVAISTGAKEKLLPFLEGRDKSKTFLSRKTLAGKYDKQLANNFSKFPSVILIGGSHSAHSAALHILNNFPSVKIDFFIIEEPKLYFPNITEAIAHGYMPELSEIDSETGKVCRYYGLREESKQLRIDVLNGKYGDQVSYHLLSKDKIPEAVKSVNPCSTIIQCTGPTTRRVEILDEKGSKIDYKERNTPEGNAVLYGPDNKPLNGIGSLGLGHSKHDGTNVYHEQARELLIVGTR